MSRGAANAQELRLKCSFAVFRRRVLASFALFCAVGAAAGCYAGAPFLFWLVPGLVFLGICVWSKRLLALFGAALFLSAAVIAWRSVPPEPFEREKANITGVVCEEPREYETSVCLILKDVTVNGEAYSYRLRLYVYAHGEDALPACVYGDTLAAQMVTIRAPKERSSVFDTDQRRVLWRSGIGSTATCDASRAVVTEGRPSPLRLSAQVRAALIARLDVLFGESAGLARALLLGDKAGLSEEEYYAFRDAGIAHLLAVSGLHITVLALALRWTLIHVFRFYRRGAFFTVLPFLFLYAAVTGFPSSILRAAILFAYLEAITLTGMPPDPLTGLAAAYLLLAAISPMRQFESGFLLSFGAMLGLFVILPVLEAAFLPTGRGRGKRAVRRTLRPIFASLSVLLGTLPAVSRAFGGVTLWSLIMNLPALPLASLCVPLLAASLLVSWIWMPLGMIISVVAALPMRALGAMAGWVAAMDAPLHLAIASMPALFCALYFLVFTACAPFFPVRNHRHVARYRTLGLTGLIAVVLASNLWVTAPIAREKGLTATFIDVGCGDSVLINAQGRLHLVDTGRGSSAAMRLTASASRLEALFLTHTDLDHVGALASVLRAGEPKTVYLPSTWPEMDIAAETEAALANCEVRFLERGDTLSLSEDVTLEVLYPRDGLPAAADNAGSLAMCVRYGSASLLLLGDLPDASLDGPLPDCDALLLAHHGSPCSSGEWALRTAAPSAAFLSVGANGSGLPDSTVLRRVQALGVPLFRTDEQGDLLVRLDLEGGVLVTPFRSGAI